MPTQWYMGYDGVEYPIEVTAREEQPMSDWMHGNNQLYDLRLTVTAPNGDEIRVYDEYRWTSGRGGRYFIGYRLDDGRSQLQVGSWQEVLNRIAPCLKGELLFETAKRRVQGFPELDRYGNILLYDWEEGEEHLRWILIAPVEQIIDWAARIHEEESR